MDREKELIKILKNYDKETRGDLELMYIEDIQDGFTYEEFICKLFECVNVWREEREYDQKAINKLVDDILNMDR